jgi:hypothetical protein
MIATRRAFVRLLSGIPLLWTSRASALSPTMLTVNRAHPHEAAHPLTPGHLVHLLCLPGLTGGGRVWTNLVKDGPAATVNGTAIPATSTSGWNPTTRRNGAGEVRVDGVNDVITFSDAPRWTGMVGITVACWVNFSSLAAAADKVLAIHSHSITPFYAWYFVVVPTTNLLYFEVRDTVSASINANGATALSTGVWTHLVASVEPGGLAQVYINGTPDRASGGGTLAAATAVFDADGPVDFGSNQGGQKWVTGAMDDLHIWRRGLGPSLVKSLYQESLVGYPRLLASRDTTLQAAAAAAATTRSQGRMY